MQKTPIVFIVEAFSKTARLPAREVSAWIREIRRCLPGRSGVVVIGADVADAAENLVQETGMDVLGLNVPSLASYNGEICKRVLTRVLTELEARVIGFVQSMHAIDYAPGLAVRLSAVCLSGVSGISAESGDIRFERTVYGGRFLERVRPTAATCMALFQPGTAPKIDTVKLQANGRLFLRTIECTPDRMRALKTKTAGTSQAAVKEAEVVVAVGRGIGSVETLDTVFRLARMFTHAAVGGSRPVCDAGWLEYSRQIGMTGVTVSPRLYLACGISGAFQHVMGMKNAGLVVAINTDPKAAIFREADIGVVEDVESFLTLLMEEHGKLGDR